MFLTIELNFYKGVEEEFKNENSENLPVVVVGGGEGSMVVKSMRVNCLWGWKT